MRAVGNKFIVLAEETHEKSTGNIILLDKFDNAQKTKPISEVVSVPDKYKDVVEEGDALIYHFNVLTFKLDNGRKVPSVYCVKDNYYYVPPNMVHGVIKRDGTIKMLGDWNIVEPIVEQEKVLESGIILIPDSDQLNKTHNMMDGTMLVVNEEMEDSIKVGDKVLLAKHSNYSIKLPDGNEVWLVENRQILCRYED